MTSSRTQSSNRHHFTLRGDTPMFHIELRLADVAERQALMRSARAAERDGLRSARSLRLLTGDPVPPSAENYVRVSSTSCGSDCGSDDVYRIRAYETTLRSPRNLWGRRFRQAATARQPPRDWPSYFPKILSCGSTILSVAMSVA